MNKPPPNIKLATNAIPRRKIPGVAGTQETLPPDGCCFAINVSQAAIVAEGNTCVVWTVPDMYKMSDCPGNTSPTSSVLSSPPTTDVEPLDELVTRPVWFVPKINSLKKTYACTSSISRRPGPNFR